MLDATDSLAKFEHPDVTAKGEERASVALTRLRTLWFNTGSLCNITCVGCFMESSPTNDALAYISRAEVAAYLDEIRRNDHPVEEIGLTGGEPFMNPDILGIMEDSLAAGFEVLVLTNAMKPLTHKREGVLALHQKYPGKITLRVSIDHYTPDRHEELRGPASWAPMIEGVRWIADNKIPLAIAGRTLWHEDDATARAGYGALFAAEGIALDVNDYGQMVLFPEMDENPDVPEITTACWDILKVSPDNMMCATSRMVIKRKGAAAPALVPCTLLPYDAKFEMGQTLAEAPDSVKLNHRHCSRFCVLGGGKCST